MSEIRVDRLVNSSGAGAVEFTQGLSVIGNATINGNLTVDGTTTTIDTVNLVIEDKNIGIGSTTSASNSTADGGGITIFAGAGGDKTLTWANSTGAWTSNQDFDLASGKVYEIGGSPVLSSTQVLGKSLPSGTIVGTSDSQTLTNKTLTSPIISGSLSIGGTTGTLGQVLQSTGTGVTWATVAAGGGSGEFNTGISSSVQITPLGYETTAFTFPSTAGRRYVIETINVSNVSIGETTANIIVSIGGTEIAYIAYNVPIPSNGSVELLKQPIVANPSDTLKVWATNAAYVGTSTQTQMYMNYSEQNNTDFFSVEASTVSIATTALTTIYTSTNNPSVIQSIILTNRTDSGDYPISVSITNGVTTTFLARNLIVPIYSTIELLDRPKRVEANGSIKVEAGQGSTIDVIVSGKQITS